MQEKVFYKYSNPNDYSLDALNHKYMYFSRPSELNDPEDCCIPISFKADDAHYKEWIKHAKALRSECDTIKSVDILKRKLQKKRFRERLYESVKVAQERFHVYSMSETNRNISLWTNPDYNSDFSGFCLGFKAFQYRIEEGDTSYFIPTCNSFKSKRRKPCIYPYETCFVPQKVEYDNDRNHFYRVFGNEYGQDHLTLLHDENTEMIKYNLFHKTAKWSEENEWRGYYVEEFSENTAAPKNQDDCKVYFSEDILDSITFGCNIDKTKRSEILGILKKSFTNFKNIKLFVAFPSGTDEVEIRPYK